MTDATTEAAIQRARLRERWEHLCRSDALRNLLEEVALWTALWTGFPLSSDEHAALNRSRRRDRSQPRRSA
jgi:hypothetical protein